MPKDSRNGTKGQGQAHKERPGRPYTAKPVSKRAFSISGRKIYRQTKQCMKTTPVTSTASSDHSFQRFSASNLDAKPVRPRRGKKRSIVETESNLENRANGPRETTGPSPRPWPSSVDPIAPTSSFSSPSELGEFRCRSSSSQSSCLSMLSQSSMCVYPQGQDHGLFFPSAENFAPEIPSVPPHTTTGLNFDFDGHSGSSLVQNFVYPSAHTHQAPSNLEPSTSGIIQQHYQQIPPDQTLYTQYSAVDHADYYAGIGLDQHWVQPPSPSAFIPSTAQGMGSTTSITPSGYPAPDVVDRFTSLSVSEQGPLQDDNYFYSSFPLASNVTPSYPF
jgi:hypothetical protein